MAMRVVILFAALLSACGNEVQLAAYQAGYEAGVAASVNLIQAKERECSTEKSIIAKICLHKGRSL